MSSRSFESKKGLRVCHVVEATAGGIQRHLRDLLANLPRPEIQSTVVYSRTRADPAFLDLATRDDLATWRSVPMVRRLSPGRDLTAIVALTRIFRVGNFDILHLHSGKAGLLGRLAALLSQTKAKVVYTPNASPFRLNRAYWFAERVLTRFCDRIIAVTPSEEAELLEANIASRQKIAQINSGIDAAHFGQAPVPADEIRDSLDIPTEARIVGTAGRLAAQKNPLRFVGLAKVLEAEPDLHFVWIGDGELREEYLRHVDSLGLTGRMHLTGYLSDIRSHLRALDVFTLLSDYESLGYVTLEAMALERATVCTDVPGTRDVVVEAETGYLVGMNREDAVLTQAAARVRALLEDQELRRLLGRGGRRRVEQKFSAATMGRETAALYRLLRDEQAVSLATTST